MSEMNDKAMVEVIIIEPDKEPRLSKIEDTLEAMQHVVGGWIEEYGPFEDPVMIVCNEEGKLDGLPLNRAIFFPDSDEIADVICGTFFLGYVPEDADSFQDFPKDLAEKYLEKFRYPERFYRTKDGLQREIVTQKMPIKRSQEHER